MKEIEGLEAKVREIVPNIVELLCKGYDAVIKINKEGNVKLMLCKPMNYKENK